MAPIRLACRALLGRSPAGSLWRAGVNGERPALQSLQHYRRGFHNLRRPGAARAPLSTAGTQDISSCELDGSKEDEEEESEKDKETRRRLATYMLMKSHCSDDLEEEMRSINELFALLDPVTDNSYSETTELQERRSLFQKKKNGLLIALLDSDAGEEKEKMEELAAAARTLRDAVTRQYQVHALRNLRRDVRKLENDVADIKWHLKKSAESQAKSVFEESVTDSRTLLERLLADSRTILERLDKLEKSGADNKTTLEGFGEKLEAALEASAEDRREILGKLEERQEDSVEYRLQQLEDSVGSLDHTVSGLEESLIERMDKFEESVKDTVEASDTSGSLDKLEETVSDSLDRRYDSVDKLDDLVEKVEKVIEKLDNKLEERD